MSNSALIKMKSIQVYCLEELSLNNSKEDRLIVILYKPVSFK